MRGNKTTGREGAARGRVGLAPAGREARAASGFRLPGWAPSPVSPGSRDDVPTGNRNFRCLFRQAERSRRRPRAARERPPQGPRCMSDAPSFLSAGPLSRFTCPARR